MALPPGAPNAVDPLLPGTGKGWRVPANCIFLLKGKAHFQVLSRFAFIGASLISVENMGKSTLSLPGVWEEQLDHCFPLKQIWADWLGVAIIPSSHEWKHVWVRGFHGVCHLQNLSCFQTRLIIIHPEAGEAMSSCWGVVRDTSPPVYVLGWLQFLNTSNSIFPPSLPLSLCYSQPELLLASLMKHTLT